MIDLIRRALKGETFVSAAESFECIRSLPHGQAAAVLGTVRKLGLAKLTASRRSRMRDLAVAMIVARITHPRSKLAMARGLAEKMAFSTLAETLDIVNASEEELYAAMDWLVERQSAIETGWCVRARANRWRSRSKAELLRNTGSLVCETVTHQGYRSSIST